MNRQKQSTRTCIKCGGGTASDFDPNCRHDFGEELKATLHELYALADLLGAGGGCIEPGAAANHARRCLDALSLHDLGAARPHVEALRQLADTHKAHPHAKEPNPINIERAEAIRRVILLDPQPIAERPRSGPYAPRPPEMGAALRPQSRAEELLNGSTFHEHLGTYGMTRFQSECLRLACPRCGMAILVRSWCHTDGKPSPPAHWRTATVRVRPGQVELVSFCSSKCARQRIPHAPDT